MAAEGLDSIKDAWPAGLVALPYIVYKVYQSLKQDSKGDNVDARIESFTKTLQTSLDKAITRIDSLNVERTGLVAENAVLKAKLTIAENEIVHLRERLDSVSEKTAK